MQENMRLGSFDIMRKIWLMLFTAYAIFLPSVAFAYIGPGAGMGAIGSLIAILSAVAFGILGIIWYPIKRLWRYIFQRRD